MKQIALLLVSFTFGQIAFASTVKIRITACPVSKSDTSAVTNCLKNAVLEEEVELQFIDLPKPGVVSNEESSKYSMFKKKVNDYEFVLAAWKATQHWRKGSPSHPVVSIQMFDKQRRAVQHSEIAFFPEKNSNFVSMRLYTDPDSKIEYSAEIQQIR